METLKLEISTGTITSTYTAVVPDDNASFGPELDAAVENVQVEINDSSAIFVVVPKPIKIFTKLWRNNPGTCKATDSNGKVIAHFKYKTADLDGHAIVFQGL